MLEATPLAAPGPFKFKQLTTLLPKSHWSCEQITKCRVTLESVGEQQQLQLGFVFRADPLQVNALFGKSADLANFKINDRSVLAIPADAFFHNGLTTFTQTKPGEDIYPVKPLKKDFDIQTSEQKYASKVAADLFVAVLGVAMFGFAAYYGVKKYRQLT